MPWKKKFFVAGLENGKLYIISTPIRELRKKAWNYVRRMEKKKIMQINHYQWHSFTGKKTKLMQKWLDILWSKYHDCKVPLPKNNINKTEKSEVARSIYLGVGDFRAFGVQFSVIFWLWCPPFVKKNALEKQNRKHSDQKGENKSYNHEQASFKAPCLCYQKKIVVDSGLTESADQKYGSWAAKEKVKSQPHSQTLFVILGMRLTRQSEKIQVERQEGWRKQDISEVCIFSTCSTNNNCKEKRTKRRRMGRLN